MLSGTLSEALNPLCDALELFQKREKGCKISPSLVLLFQETYTYFMIAQIPTEAQMAIISRYANRVRSAKFLYQWPTKLCPVKSFLQTLAYSSKVLMPNLRDLHVRSHFTHLLRPLLGPRLRHLCICASIFKYQQDLQFWPRISLHMILLSLPTTCPSLESFTFYLRQGSSSRPDPWDGPLALPVSYAIQNLQKLRTVNVPAITKDALTYLGGLSSFTSIKTRLPTGSDLEDFLNLSRSPILFENFNSVDWEIEEWRDVEVFTHVYGLINLPRYHLDLSSFSIQAYCRHFLTPSMCARLSGTSSAYV
jgi:hypothetical protein